MSYSLREKRAILKSTHAYIQTQLNANFSGVTTAYTLKQAAKANKPVICIQVRSTEHLRKEVGSTNLWDNHLIVIDIFATSGGQAEDLADFIISQVKGGYAYYDYAKTNATDANWTASVNGRVQLVSWVQDEALLFAGSTDESDMHRHVLSFIVRKTG